MLKRRFRRGGKLHTTRYYYLQYKLNGMVSDRWESLRVTDKQVAEKVARDRIRELEQEQMGVVPPKSLRKASNTPMVTHLSDYLDDLRSRGRAGRNGHGAKQLETRFLTLINQCGWKLVSDISPEAFISWRNVQELSPRTPNHYLNAVCGLLNWMEKMGRILANPLKHIAKVETRGNEFRIRRALTDSEVARLIESSPKRGIVYLAAARSGLRQEDLRQIVWDALDFEKEIPTLTVRKCVSKNRKQQTLPLLPELVEALKDYRSNDWKLSDRVFPRLVPRARTLTMDLEACGIPYRDERGR